MGKVKHKLRDLSIPSTFVLFVIIFLLLAVLLVEVEKTLLKNAQRDIAFQYSEIVEGFNGTKVWGNQSEYLLSEQDGKMMQLYEMGIRTLPSLTYLACFILAGIIFYRSKIRKPLMVLTTSASRIAANDLDFSIAYDRTDEMGLLCTAFEKMRSALESNNREMWRQMDDRKRLNAAFSHDLRTPLTVLEGHLNILQKYAPTGKLSADEISETYCVMASQLSRLKNYVSYMNDLQRLKDIPISVKPVDASDLLDTLKDTAEIVCSGKQLIFQNEVFMESLVLDTEIVMQVFENLLSNAVRYAKSSVSVVCKTQGCVFSISVMDDGSGFDSAALKSATDPFYTTEKKADSQHFGLGLNICKILCLRHGGSIVLKNRSSGGASVTATFEMN